MKFNETYNYVDAVLSQMFEGIEQTVDWTDHEIYLLKLAETYALVMGFTPETRKAADSNTFIVPFLAIRNLLDFGEKPKASFLIFSGHDFQIANQLLTLAPDFNFTYIQYASQIKFELYQKGQVFLVKTIYNGENLGFDRCDLFPICEYEDWISRYN